MEIAICIIDKPKNTISFAGARRPICIIQDNELTYIKGDRIGIDGNKDLIYTNHEFELKPNTQIYLYSDGYQDQFGGKENRRFMSKNLRELFQKIEKETINDQLQEISTTFENWRGANEPIDDILILGIKI